MNLFSRKQAAAPPTLVTAAPSYDDQLTYKFPPSPLPILGTESRFLTKKATEFLVIRHGDPSLKKFQLPGEGISRGGIAIVGTSTSTSTSSASGSGLTTSNDKPNSNVNPSLGSGGSSVDASLWFITEPCSDGQILKDVYGKTIAFLRYPSLISHAIFDMEPPRNLDSPSSPPPSSFKKLSFFSSPPSFPGLVSQPSRMFGVCDLPALGEGVCLKATYNGSNFLPKERRGLEISLILPQLLDGIHPNQRWRIKFPVLAHVSADGGRIVVAEGVDVSLIILIFISVSSMMDEIHRERNMVAFADLDLRWRGIFSTYYSTSTSWLAGKSGGVV